MCKAFLKNVKILTPLFFLIILHACSYSDTLSGAEYSEEEMANILTDIHLAEARVSKMKFRSPDSSALVFKRLEEDIYKKHNIDTALYKSSYTYYANDVTRWKKVYELVNKNLNSQQ